MKYVYIAAAFIISLTWSNATFAYYTTDQSVTQYSETISLYTIDYYFGNKNDVMYLPVMAERGLLKGQSTSTLGYEFLVDGENPTSVGSASAVVVGDVPIVDGMYKVPAGKNGHFTLFVLLTTSADELEADYALQVTNLPFLRGEEKMKQYLNIHELSHYQTPEVEFNASNPSAE